MKTLRPLQNLWLLFGVQTALLIFFFVCFAFFQPRFVLLISRAEKLDGTKPVLVQRVNAASPEQLRKDALILVDMNEDSSKFIQSTLANVIKILYWLCLGLSILTVWLGACVYQLQRQSRN